MYKLQYLICLLISFAIISCNSESSSTSSNEQTPASSNAKPPKDAKTTGSKIIETANGKYHSLDPEAKPYRLNIPVDWVVKEHVKSGSVAAKAPTTNPKEDFDGMIEVNVRQQRMDYDAKTKHMQANPMNLKENMDNYLEGLKRAYEEMEVEGIETVKIGGEEAQLATYTYLNQREFPHKLKAKTYICQYDRDNYIFTLKAAADQFEAMQGTFEDVKNSFDFEP